MSSAGAPDWSYFSLTYIDYWTLDARVDTSSANVALTAGNWKTWFTGTQITLTQDNPYFGLDGQIETGASGDINFRLVETVSGSIVWTGTLQSFTSLTTVNISVILSSTYKKGSNVQLELQAYSSVNQTLTNAGGEMGLGIGTFLVDTGSASGSSANYYAYPSGGVTQTYQLSLGGSVIGAGSINTSSNTSGTGVTLVYQKPQGTSYTIISGAIGQYTFGFNFAGSGFGTVLSDWSQASDKVNLTLSSKTSASSIASFSYISWIMLLDYPASVVSH
jgi:hypothetical protein